jgi:predicted PurR-regulated permease PerM
MERRLLEPLFFIAVLIGTIVVVFLLFRPFLYTLTLAGVLAYLTSGIYHRLLAKLRSASGTALLMTALVFVALLVPLTLIGLRIVYEASGMYVFVSEQATQERLTVALGQLQHSLDTTFPGVQVDAAKISAQLGSLFGWLVSSLGSLLGSFASLVVNFLLLLLFYFYLVRDGARLTQRLKELSPLASDKEDQVIARVGRSITATVRGSLVLALLQGLVSGIGFIAFGLPNPALWGSVVVLAAFVPTIGTALVQIPAVFFLAATGHTAQAIGLACWAALAVGMLDNILGPKLMARGMHMHPLITLLAILGGVGFYGPLGVILGPITVSLLYALLDIYLAVIRNTPPLTVVSKSE